MFKAPFFLLSQKRDIVSSTCLSADAVSHKKVKVNGKKKTNLIKDRKTDGTYDKDSLPLRLVGTIQGNTCTQSGNPVCTLVCMQCSRLSC